MPVVDCTLRDGGYYNNWDFEEDFVDEYLNAMVHANVEYVEIGFRGVKGGIYANVNDLFLTRFSTMRRPKLAVMVNAKDALSYEFGPDGFILAHFIHAKASRVSLVRIAAHFNEAVQCEKMCLALKALGYEVALNLMQCADKSMDALLVVKRTVEKWGCVDVLYLADSLGNLNPLDLTVLVDRLVEDSDRQPLGVHMHDNRGMALANTMAARNAGALWLDSTVGGMGRGAGNAKTEYLLIELGIPYKPEPIFDFCFSHMDGMHAIFGWGTSLFYALAAKWSIHPTYVQNLIATIRVRKNILNVMRKLRYNRASLFDAKLLRVLCEKEKP